MVGIQAQQGNLFRCCVFVCLKPFPLETVGLAFLQKFVCLAIFPVPVVTFIIWSGCDCSAKQLLKGVCWMEKVLTP